MLIRKQIKSITSLLLIVCISVTIIGIREVLIILKKLCHEIAGTVIKLSEI